MTVRCKQTTNAYAQDMLIFFAGMFIMVEGAVKLGLIRKIAGGRALRACKAYSVCACLLGVVGVHQERGESHDHQARPY